MDWVVEDNDDGTFDVFLGGRPERYGCTSIEEAEQVVSQGGGSEYTMIEPDGYRVRHQVR